MTSEKLFNHLSIPLYPNYQDLFNATPPYRSETNSGIDMIMVPLARSASHIKRPARLAGRAGITLMAMCSHDANISETAELIEGMKQYAPPTWYAVDVPPGYEIPGVKLLAQEEIPPQARKDKDFNLPQIRDSGLVIGKTTGSEGVFFHDDDLRVELSGLKDVEGLLQYGYDLAGLQCADSPYMPDRSGIQHMKREILSYHLSIPWYDAFKGVASGQASGNSLAVNPQTVDGHFVRGIYNEDTIFMFPNVAKGKAKLGVVDRYFQDIYNPFQAKRFAQEEFGDIVHDGLYGYLAKHRYKDTVHNGEYSYTKEHIDSEEALHSAKYWQNEIEARRRTYDSLLSAYESKRNPRYFSQDFSEYFAFFEDPLSKQLQGRRRKAIMAGLAINETLTGKDFVGYIRVWGEDRKRWNKMMSTLPQGKPQEALAHLALDSYITNAA